MYDVNSNNPNPVISYDNISKNVTAVGFHGEGKWMYTGGEDNSARLWDLRYFPIAFVFSLSNINQNFSSQTCV
jgi:WD40 repeat protein